MKAFDESILLGMMGIADVDRDAYTRAKADQGGRKITALGTANPACIAIQPDGLGPPVGA
jgi:hypothetical protein